MNSFYFTDLLDLVFEVINSELGWQMFGIGVFSCVIALFCRLRGSR